MDDIIEALRKHPTTVCAACDVWGKCGYNERCECICHKTETLLEDAADEIERLRRLIHEWSDAHNFGSLYGDDLTKAVDRAIAAEEMLRKEARRG